jgi:hypothetical protein
LKVFENFTIWRPLQEDQDRSIPPSFDLEKREGRRDAFPKAPSVQQEIYPKFLPVIPLLPTKLSSEDLKDKAAYITFTLQVSKGSGQEPRLTGRVSGPLRKETPSNRWKLLLG